MYVLKRRTDDPEISTFEPGKSLVHRLRRYFRKKIIKDDWGRYSLIRPSGLEIFSDDRTEYGREMLQQMPAADIVNLHWVSGFLDYFECLPSIAKTCPIVWRLADMNVFTGGCHYDLDCGFYAKSCGQCPQLGSPYSDDLSRQIWQRKQRAFSAIPINRLHLVATSRWIADRASKSSLLGRFPLTVIPNGLDLEVFKPCSRLLARQRLGLPIDSKIVLFISDDLRKPRKGLSLLMDAMNRIGGKDNMLLVTIGQGAESLIFDCAHINLGYIENDERMVEAYNAADLFVIPSLQESFGQTAIEAMACGTPVVGFQSGGMSDTVQNHRTGLLVPAGDIQALSEALDELLMNSAKCAQMGAQCRNWVEGQYGVETIAARYLRLYEFMQRSQTL